MRDANPVMWARRGRRGSCTGCGRSRPTSSTAVCRRQSPTGPVTFADPTCRPVDLGGDVRNTLQSMMSDASTLAPHEWYAHGTCSGVTPDVFFSDAAALTEQARKVLDPMFTEAEGGRIQLSDGTRQVRRGIRRRSRRTRPPQLSQRDRPRQRRLRAAPVASAGHRAEDPRRHAVAEGPDPQRSAARPRMPACERALTGVISMNGDHARLACFW